MQIPPHFQARTLILLLSAFAFGIPFLAAPRAEPADNPLAAGWSQQKNPHFRFMFLPHMQPLAEALSKSSTTYRKKLLADLGTPGLENVDVILCDSLLCMQKMAPGRSRVPAWAAGMAFAANQTVLLRTDAQSAARGDLDSVFLHELAHLALTSAVGNRILPRWFQEGFAIYQSGEWSMGRVTTLASGVLSGRLFSIQALEDSFPDSPGDVQLAYAQSIDFVAYLLGRFGRSKFHKLIQLLGRGWSFVNAMEEAYDQGIFKIESDWHADLKLRFTWVPVITGTATLWLIATLALVAAWIRKKKARATALLLMDDEDAPDDEPPPALTSDSP